MLGARYDQSQRELLRDARSDRPNNSGPHQTFSMALSKTVKRVLSVFIRGLNIPSCMLLAVDKTASIPNLFEHRCLGSSIGRAVDS